VTNPLVCIGVNPSTTKPGQLDDTIKVVKARSISLGYDGWVSWGNLIGKRKYLKRSLSDIYTILGKNRRCFSIGYNSKAGYPLHPLYPNKNLMPHNFNLPKYTRLL